MIAKTKFSKQNFSLISLRKNDFTTKKIKINIRNSLASALACSASYVSASAQSWSADLARLNL
jgi:hypothetical protein